MTRVKALTKNGRITWCSAKNPGSGSCNHIFHQTEGVTDEQFQWEVDKYCENKARLEKHEKEDVNHQNSDKHNKKMDKLIKHKKKDSTEDYFKQDLDRYNRRMTRLANKSISSALSLNSLMKSKF